MASDARQALWIAELATAQVVDGDGASSPCRNAFGEPVRVEPPLDPVARVKRAAALASAGERVALVASTEDLSAARSAMREIAAQRLGLVFHAVEPRSADVALALADVGWALLFPSDV